MELRRRRTLRDLLNVPFRNRIAIATIFLAAVCMSLIYCIVTPASYRAETRLVVKGGGPDLSALDRYRPYLYAAHARDNGLPIVREIEMVKGQYLTEKVVARVGNRVEALRTGKTPVGQIAEAIRSATRTVFASLGLSTSPSEPAKRSVLTFLDHLRVTSLPDTGVVSIAFDWTDPDSAALVANTYADEYAMQWSLLNDSRRLYAFYSEQADILEKKLKEAGERYEKFVSDNRIADAGLQRELSLRNVNDIRGGINDADTEISQIHARIKQIREMARKPNTWVYSRGSYPERQGYLRSLDELYTALRNEKEQLLKSRAPDDAEVRGIDNRMESLRIQKIDTALEMAAIDLSLAQNRRSTLARQLSAEEGRLRTVTTRVTALEGLGREKDMAEWAYRTYRKNAEDLRIASDLEAHKITSVKVLIPAVPPITAAYPRMGVIVLWSAVGGLLLGLLFSLTREFFNHTFTDDDQVTRILDIPLLITVPEQNRYLARRAGPRGAVNGGVTRLRRVFGQELRRPLWGNGSAKSGTPLLLTLLVGALSLLYPFRSFFSPDPFPFERVFLIENREQNVSLLTIYPSLPTKTAKQEPVASPAPGSAPPELALLPEKLLPEKLLPEILLSEELEKQRRDLFSRRQEIEAELGKIRPEVR